MFGMSCSLSLQLYFSFVQATPCCLLVSEGESTTCSSQAEAETILNDGLPSVLRDSGRR